MRSWVDERIAIVVSTIFTYVLRAVFTIIHSEFLSLRLSFFFQSRFACTIYSSEVSLLTFFMFIELFNVFIMRTSTIKRQLFFDRFRFTWVTYSIGSLMKLQEMFYVLNNIRFSINFCSLSDNFSIVFLKLTQRKIFWQPRLTTFHFKIDTNRD